MFVYWLVERPPARSTAVMYPRSSPPLQAERGRGVQRTAEMVGEVGRRSGGRARRNRIVTDREVAERPAGGRPRGRHPHRGTKAGGEDLRVEVAATRDAGDQRQGRDRDETCRPRHVVVDRRRDAGARGGGGGQDRFCQ